MRTKPAILIYLLILVLGTGLPMQLAAQDPDVDIRKDLKTMLALKGKSCDEITDVQNRGENDYLVTCQNGKRYRIRIDADERVIVEDQ